MNEPRQDDTFIGKILDNSYEIHERIAKGGMGKIYRAKQLRTSCDVAVKIMHPGYQFSPEFIERFRREARVLSELSNHINIVKILDFGNTDTHLYIVMEYLSGDTLYEAVPPNKGLPTPIVFKYMQQICAALEVIHSKGLVHRDLKPQNIFVARYSSSVEGIKIMDFGIAKTPKESHITQAGEIMGTPPYISPEQMDDSRKVDARSDIYALGAVLYFMIAGRPPYTGNTSHAIWQRQLDQRPDPIDFAALKKPEAEQILPVILKALQSDQENRYASTAELMDDLAEACSPKEREIFFTPSINAPPTAEDRLFSKEADSEDDHEMSEMPNPFPISLTLLYSFGVIVVFSLLAFLLTLIFLAQNAPATSAKKDTRVSSASSVPTPATEPAAEAPSPADAVASAAARDPIPVPIEAPVPAAGSGPAPASEPAPAPASGPGVDSVAAAGSEIEGKIAFGMVGPFSGTSGKIGIRVLHGMQARFHSANERGGVRNRKIEILRRDDEGNPESALRHVKELVEQKVLALIGVVGDDVVAEIKAYVNQAGVPLFGAVTGAKSNRSSPGDACIFYYRPSYVSEIQAMVEFFKTTLDLRSPKELGLFIHDTPEGERTFSEMCKLLKGTIRRFPYDPADPRSIDAIAQKASAESRDSLKAVVMASNHWATARFVEKIREGNSSVLLASCSTAEGTALIEELNKNLGVKRASVLAKGLVVTQIVPFCDGWSEYCVEYRERLKRYFPETPPDFVSLEGYIVADIMLSAWERAKDATPKGLIAAFKEMGELDLGTGGKIQFDAEHQASHRIWGTKLDARDGEIRYEEFRPLECELPFVPLKK